MTPHSRLQGLAALAAALALPAVAGAAPLRIEEAIRAAWAANPALRASASQVEASRADAAAVRDARLPTLSLEARGVRTDEPMMAFGLKLDQARIGAADFSPATLNAPEPIGGWGGTAAVSVPLFTGGRLWAGQRAAGAMADAEAALHVRRRDELAVAVVEAYFGAQAAEEGVRYTEELVAHAVETERLVGKRNGEGLALDADLARATAFRAQAEAELAAAQQRRATARSGLALLTGLDPAGLELASPAATPTPAAAHVPGRSGEPRPDVAAARLRRDAAEAGVTAARGSLLPAVFARAAAETMRSADLEDGAHWTTLGVVARWDLSLSSARSTAAAQARARAATDALRWQELLAEREVTEAEGAVSTADARVRSAEVAVEASGSARALRAARHREGLLPLTDVLDAEAALAGARALLLASRLEARVARARLALATHSPIEGLAP